MLVNLHLVFNVTLLKCYVGDIVPALDPIEFNDGFEYEVDAISYHQWIGWRCNHIEYLVFFVGYDTSHNKWLFEANLANALDILLQYQTVHGLA